jgi:hypothetical protein
MLVHAAIEQTGRKARAAFYLADHDGRARRHITGMRPAYAPPKSSSGFGNSRVSTLGQPEHRATELVVLGEIAINCNTIDLVVADDRLNELIAAMRNVRNPAS